MCKKTFFESCNIINIRVSDTNIFLGERYKKWKLNLIVNEEINSLISSFFISGIRIFLQINNKIMYSGIMSKLKYTDSFFEKE